MLKIVFVILLLIGIISAYFLFNQNSSKTSQPLNKNESSNQESSEVDKFITANPVDLTQIRKVSKFRSCSGHDFSGQNVSGVRERNRSMKHYFKPAEALTESIGEVKVFAPFNGKIKSVQDEREPRGKQIILTTDSISWEVTIFHVDLLPTFKTGSKISAGQLLGHAHIASRGSDFDIAITKFVGAVPDFKTLSSDQAEKMQDFFFSMMMMDSVFNYMTPDVLADFKEFGITPDNIITTMEERDQNPCDFEIRDESPSDWVELQN